MLPSYYPPPTTVYYHFRKWSESTNLVFFLRRPVAEVRRKTGRKPRPTVVVTDSRSVRSGYAQSQKGVDGFKKVKGVYLLLKDMRLYYQSVSLVKADKGYCDVGSGLDGCIVECVKSNSGTAEVRPLSGRRVVERTDSWPENYRRLCRNYERCLSSARAMTNLAAILFMLRYC